MSARTAREMLVREARLGARPISPGENSCEATLVRKKMRYGYKSIQIFLCMIIFAISGCTFNQPDGNVFTEYLNTPKDKALVYVYRSKGEKFGYNRTYFLYSKHQGSVTTLLHGGYFPLVTEPGILMLIASLESRGHFNYDPFSIVVEDLIINPDMGRVIMKVEAGETYYVKFFPVTHLAYFQPTLQQVSSEIGGKELRNTKLLH